MSNVVQLHDKRTHLAGPAKCIGCGHEWVAVSPAGTTVFECPECGEQKGARRGVVTDDESINCECGCWAFSALINGNCRCLGCGTEYSSRSSWQEVMEDDEYDGQ